MDASDRHNGKRKTNETNERTDGRTDEETRRVASLRPSVRPSLRLKTHGVENRRRKSEPTFGTCVMQKRLRFSTKKIGAGFRLRLERVIFRGRFSEARD